MNQLLRIAIGTGAIVGVTAAHNLDISLASSLVLALIGAQASVFVGVLITAAQEKTPGN